MMDPGMLYQSDQAKSTEALMTTNINSNTTATALVTAASEVSLAASSKRLQSDKLPKEQLRNMAIDSTDGGASNSHIHNLTNSEQILAQSAASHKSLP